MKNLLSLSFSSLPPVAVNLLHLGFAQNTHFSGSLLDLGFAQTQAVSGSLLDLSFEVSPLPEHRFHFRGSQTQGFGDFDVKLFLGGRMINACHIAETLSIQRGENESSLCEFVLLPPRKRKKPKPIDLFQWYQQRVQVYVVSARENVLIFNGVVDDVDFTMLKGRLRFRCSDRREDGFAELSPSFVKKIGYTSKSAHGDSFASVKDEVETRLQTVPASLERNLSGKMTLTNWQGGSMSHRISPCAIYQREPELSLVEVGGVLGTVAVTLNLDYTRLLERRITLNIDGGLGICEYGQYQGLIKLEDVASAIAQTGWALGSFQAERVEPNGWYTCPGGRFAWLRDVATINSTKTDEDGKESSNARDITSITRRLDTHIKSGSFNVAKRWQQKIRESYRITFSSGAPSARREEISFDVSLSLPENLTWKAESVHEKGLRYDYDQRTFFYRQPNVVSFPKSFVWRQSEFGDFFADLVDESHEFRKTEKVALETVRTMILASHRNRIQFEMKFLPTASIQQKHHITHSHFVGYGKVCALRHQFDFQKGLASSELTYAFLKKFGNGGPSYRLIERETLPTFPFAKGVRFGRVEIGEKTEIDDTRHVGVIYRNVSNTKLFYLEKLTVRTPEIEANSTENREVVREFDYGMDILDDNVEILL